MAFTVRVRSKGDGESVARYVPTNRDTVQAGLEQWCDRPPTVRESGFTSTPDGDMEFYLQILNPGAESVTVETPQIDDDHVTWDAAFVEVPGGGTAQLTIFGEDVGCEPGEVASWSQGRLLVDGEPYEVGSTDAWC